MNPSSEHGWRMMMVMEDEAMQSVVHVSKTSLEKKAWIEESITADKKLGTKQVGSTTP